MKTKYIHIIILLSYLILTLFASITFFYNINNKVIGNINHPNAQGEILLTNIMKNSLLNHKILNWTYTDFLNYPYGEQLSDTIRHTVHLYLSGTIAIFTNPVTAYNVTFFIIIILNAYFMFLLAQYIFKNYYLSWLAGLFYTFNLYVLLKINIGSLHKSAIFFIPLYILFLLKLLDKPKVIYIIMTFVLLALTHLQYPMYSLYCLLFSIILIIYRLFKNKKMQELKYFIVIAILSVAFLYWLGMIGHITFDLSIYENEPWQLNPLYFIKNYLVYPTSLPLGISPTILFLGLLGFIYIKEARFFFLTAVFFIILSFGFYFSIFSIKIVLPFYFLAKTVKLLSNIIFYAPIRSLSLAYICLIISAIFFVKIAYDKFGKKSILIIATIFILELIFLYPEVFPIKTTDLPKYSIVSQIKNKDGNVLCLPSFEKNNKVLLHKSMLITLMSNKKMVNTYEYEPWINEIIENNDSAYVLKELRSKNIKFIIIYNNLKNISEQEKTFMNSIKNSAVKIDKDTMLYEIN
ncbi:MAG: hypothetical protein PHR82_04410 [Endomicrobiaceae bacterium]|nr:hypothetical protein [Endomicrobiaceae bacterium]